MFYFGRLIEQCGFHGNTAGVRPALKIDNFFFIVSALCSGLLKISFVKPQIIFE